MTDTPTIFTAHDVPDLLNALPTLFGFRPSDSLVAVATRGSRRRFGFRLRVDIPALEHVDQLSDLVADHLRQQGAEGAILVAVTEQQEVARSLLAAVESHLDEIELVIAVRADCSRYWIDALDFPEDGIAYEISDHHLSIVKAIAAGQQILPDRAALAARFAPVEGARRRDMMQLTDAVIAEIVHLSDDEVRALADQVGSILDRVLAGESLTDADAVRLSVWVSKRELRNEVWARITRDTATEMLSLLTRVASIVVPPFEPAVLSLAGFAAWLSGDGAQALMAVERALEADPEQPMALGVLKLLEGGVSPVHWNEF
ncbi:MAG: DUF4192 domain-containing protein [Aeromicrobium sp.]